MANADNPTVTPAARLLEVALNVIDERAPEPATLRDIYAAVERSVELTGGDVIPPMLHGKRIAEPRWHRNVRNVLQHEKDAFRLVNAGRNLWRRATPDPATSLDLSQAWALVLQSATDAAGSGREFESTLRGKRYRVASVTKDTIMIERLDGNAAARLTRGVVERAVGRLNAAGGVTGRRTLDYTVAKEVALAHLHPSLLWSEDGDRILAIGHTTTIESGDPFVLGSTYREPQPAPSGPRDPFELDPDVVDRGLAGHAATQNALRDFLVERGAVPRSPGPGEPQYDIAWEWRGTVWVGEVKSTTPDNEEKQLRLGLGQVLR